MTRLTIHHVAAELPAGLAALRAAAQAEGYRHLDRLWADWTGGTMRFDRHGELLLAAYVDAELVAIGGLTRDPAAPDALRMRRFYVAPPYRRSGIGRGIAERLLSHAGELGCPCTVNAAPSSFPFWEALGFVPDPRNGHSHILADRL